MTGPGAGTNALVRHLVTHSGGFHADELLSSVILTRLWPGARILRSRDPAWITPAPDRIVYDVGRAFDPDAGIFDHHQRGAPARDDGQPFSSFGLIWRRFGPDYLGALGIPAADAGALVARIDAEFVLPVDLMDNGALDPATAGALAGLTLPVLLESLKPVFDDRDGAAEDRAFDRALGVARTLFEGVVAQAAAELRAEGAVARALAFAGGGRVLELPCAMPFQPAIERLGAGHLWFVVFPRGGDWALNGIRAAPGTFALRADLPQRWAGLVDGALEAVTGVAGARFCHNGRFIAVAESRAAILRMAALAVAEAEAEAGRAGARA